MQQPFDNPEIIKLFGILLDNLFEESGRGALLIATSHVDEYLTSLLNAVLPLGLSQNHKDKLFKYPGSLSSLSAKIELAYAFRLIDKELYNNLNALRKLRNDAAHSSSKFELHELNEKLQNIYNMGSGFVTYIRETSVRLLMQDKLALINKSLDKLNLSDEEKEKKIQEVFQDKKRLEILEKQVPFWELTIGLCLLCWLIVSNKEKILKLTTNINVWSDLLPKDT